MDLDAGIFIDPPYLDLMATALSLFVAAMQDGPATFGEPDYDDATYLLERVRGAALHARTVGGGS